MMGSRIKKQVCLGAVAAALVLAAGILPAMAYFTTYVTAKGGYTIDLAESTTMEEEFSKWTKTIVISNTGSTDCYVRVKVFSGSQYPITFSGDAKWTLGSDGYYYYSDIVPAGGETAELKAKIDRVKTEDTDSFNVVVIQESTAVLYQADGTPYADWNATLDTTSDSFDVEDAQG